MTDIWSCALGYHFLTGLGDSRAVDTITTEDNFFTNETSHGAGILWSQMTNLPVFKKRQFPLPIVVVDSIPLGAQLLPNNLVPLNSTHYEFTPWELGSYDPNLSAFVDVRFMGTRLLDGKPRNSSSCVTAFDQTSFIIGTSSSLFNVRICATFSFIFDSELPFLAPYLFRKFLAVWRRHPANRPYPAIVGSGVNPCCGCWQLPECAFLPLP